MSSSSSLRWTTALWKRWRDRLSRRETSSAAERGTERRLKFESLENRALLSATDFAGLAGRVFDDFTGDGWTAGEEVAGATVQLYRDNGDGVFQSGSDNLLATKVTDAAGKYRFDDLVTGNYFIRQPQQNIAGRALLEYVSSRITLSPLDVQGVNGDVIDSFDNDPQSVTASLPQGDKLSELAMETTDALGGERDLFVELTSPLGELRLNVNSYVPGRLEFTAGSTTQGRRMITWDGIDGDGATLNPTGLDHVDLTDNGTITAVQILSGADHPDGMATLRVYTDAQRWSEATVSIPETGGEAKELAIVRFSQFQPKAGGGADFTNVGAIQLEIDGKVAVDGQIDSMSFLGPRMLIQDFGNLEVADLSVTKMVDNAQPRVGENVTFTVTVSNAGPQDATNVDVKDVLPPGTTFVSANPSRGTYSSATGIWNVGTLQVGAQATLQLVATAGEGGVKTNVAQVSVADQFDPDSTPNNNVPTEDDQDSASISPQLIDLSLTKTVDRPQPICGEDVTFTIVVSNAGPTGATGVTVNDALPAGLTLVSANTTQGNYNQGTGVWTVGELAAGGNARLEITAQVVGLDPVTNTAEVMSAGQPDVDSIPGNGSTGEDDRGSVTVTPQVADLSLTKSVSTGTPNVGEQVTFTITVSNSGPHAATNVSVTDQLPAGLTFVSATPSQGQYLETSGVWTVGSVGNGVAATLQIVATVAAPGAVSNTAQVTSSDQCDPDSTPNNSVPTEDDQSTVPLNPQVIDLSLTKTVDKSTAQIGSDVVFTITVGNAGPALASEVAVLDLLPTGLQFVSATPSQGSYSDTTGVWTVGSLAKDASASLAMVAKVNTASLVINTAQVSSAREFDVDSTPGNSVTNEDDQASALVQPLVPIQRTDIPTINKRQFLAR